MYYVGGTTMLFEKRFDRHRAMLRRGDGPRLLQACYDLYGEENLSFEPLKAFPPEEVAAREKEAIEHLKPDLNIYLQPTHIARPRGRSRAAETFVHGGVEHTAQTLAEVTGLKASTIHARRLRGLTGAALVASPHRGPRKTYTRRK